eukprot:TRINITY_DN1906_c0_g1_i2.p1 TRINITY_DN1906_c0_g1~~TRINITY_DN1906_c0_g1_i2.p1  ORF type:complete len:607 (-),score=182.21 TRINITY_DN1906_c0_g1_i2:53-1753(-)
MYTTSLLSRSSSLSALFSSTRTQASSFSLPRSYTTFTRPNPASLARPLIPLAPSRNLHSTVLETAPAHTPPLTRLADEGGDEKIFIAYVPPEGGEGEGALENGAGEATPIKELDFEVSNFSTMQPTEIKKHLDEYIIGQDSAKKAVAVAMRNRWRRKNVPEDLRKEIIPKNILMIGPTGVGKTEVARRMAKLADAPFIKVEATKFTEVGFRGQDVDSIIKDLVEVGINHVRERELEKLTKLVNEKVEENILNLLIGKPHDNDDAKDRFFRDEFRTLLRQNSMDDIKVTYEKPIMPKNQGHGPGQVVFNLPPNVNVQQQFFRAAHAAETSKGKPEKKMPIRDVRPLEIQAVRADLVRDDVIVAQAVKEVEEYGIVFIDEIDKIVGSSSRVHNSPDASDEGVQRDLLPIIEGTKISTEHGDVDTSKILFIAAGAFHHVKPSDLLAELQGRLPIRVQLEDLDPEQMYRIMVEPSPNLVRQQIALMKTEGVDLQFTEAGLRRIASIASEVNASVENIGARRLYTVMEKVLEDLSFDASEKAGTTVLIGVPEVEQHMEDLKKKDDLKSYIL